MDFDPEIPEHARIIEIRSTNGERIQQLAAQGVGVNIDRAGSVLEFLLDYIASDSPDRMAFELRWAQGIADTLEQGESQIAQAKLLQGVAGVAPMNRQQRRQAQRTGH